MASICKICNRKFKSDLSLGKHINMGHKLSKEKYVLQVDHSGKYPTCKCGCGQFVKFTRGKFSDYINGHSSKNLSNNELIKIIKKRQQTNLDRHGNKNYTNIEKNKQTVLDRYGVENVFQLEKIKEEIKQNNLIKHGLEYNSQREDVKEKANQTKLDRYGNENYNNKEKNKQTVLDRYGVENVFQLDEIKEKSKKTMKEKHGVEYSMQSKKVQEKSKQTNLENLDVEYPMQSKQIREKYKQTILDEYGVENISQTNKFRKNARARMVKNIESRCGQVSPNYNPAAISILEAKAKELGITDLQHAENGGEYHIKELNYWVDGHSEEKNIVMEYYEKRHKKQKERDKRRRQEIIDFLGCDFIEIWEK